MNQPSEITYNEGTFTDALQAHRAWLNDEGGERLSTPWRFVLRDADLRGADLRDADLRGANLPIYQKWTVTWRIDGQIYIGCKSKSLTEWDAWFASDEEYETPRNTADFERIEAAYQHARRMVEIYQKYEAGDGNQ